MWSHMHKMHWLERNYPVSILYKSTAGRYRPVRVADRPITARCRFIKNASWVKTAVVTIMSLGKLCIKYKMDNTFEDITKPEHF